jgi:rubrerythrin
LIRILQAAHAGELAAAYAYQGHWRARIGARRRSERDEIQRIEAAEWHHRSQVADLLAALGSGPVGWREASMGAIGRFFGALCFVGGRFLPMYAAGRLEAMNVGQYVDAAAHARASGHEAFGDQLDAMVEEEARHEAWFSDQCRGHWMLPAVSVIGRWSPADPTTAEPAEPAELAEPAEAPMPTQPAID